MQAVISSWFNLKKTIFKPENETMYGTNDHLWHLKFAEYCVQEMKKLVEESDREKKKQTLWPLFMDGIQLPQG